SSTAAAATARVSRLPSSPRSARGTFRGTFQRRRGEIPSMPRPNKPWFRKSKDAWYATVEGRKVSLGVRGRHGRKEALRAFAARLVGGTAGKPSKGQNPSTGGGCSTVGKLIEMFLADARTRLRPDTVRMYAHDLGVFRRSFGRVRPDEIMSPD